MKTTIPRTVHWLTLAILLTTNSTTLAFHNPTVGRWLSRDPIDDPVIASQTTHELALITPRPNTLFSVLPDPLKTPMHSYAFVNNVPISAADFLGLKDEGGWQPW